MRATVNKISFFTWVSVHLNFENIAALHFLQVVQNKNEHYRYLGNGNGGLNNRKVAQFEGIVTFTKV